MNVFWGLWLVVINSNKVILWAVRPIVRRANIGRVPFNRPAPMLWQAYTDELSLQSVCTVELNVVKLTGNALISPSGTLSPLPGGLVAEI